VNSASEYNTLALLNTGRNVDLNMNFQADASVSNDRTLGPCVSLSEYSCGILFSFFKLHGLHAV
jgi:hypothetical protein